MKYLDTPQANEGLDQYGYLMNNDCFRRRMGVCLVKFEKRFQYLGNQGVVFTAAQVTLLPSDRGHLSRLHFAEAKKAHYQVTQMIVELYDRMQAGHLSCVMTVRISKPLTRAQGDALNAQRTSLIQIASSASGSAAGTVGSLGGPYVSSLSAYAVGKSVGRHMGNVLPTFHAGDVIVTLDAQVQGGIGPQRSTLSLVVKS